jgi:histidinol-phosphate aminotransferase
MEVVVSTVPLPAGTGELLDLSDNTSLYGVPPAAWRVLGEPVPADAHRYPTAFADGLRTALARYTGAARDQITTGCGSDDVLDAAIRTAAEPGDRIAFPDPSFSMLPHFARRNRLEAVPVPLTAALDIDAGRMLETRARVLYLCSPNNPTGTAASRAAIERVLRGASGLVILDEAYAEFAEESWLGEAIRMPHLLVVRTLSKAFGLAGLRVGYGVGHAGLIARLEEARGPYRVAALAERVAAAALSEDLEWMRARAACVRRDRARLVHALTALGFAPLSSAANFVLVPVPDAHTTAERMRRAGVVVRAFPALTRVGDAVRITVGPTAVMERALFALREAQA